MIEIRQPELVALILERLHTGEFDTVEAVLYQALTEAPLPQRTASPAITTADMLSVFKRSPYQEVDIEPASIITEIGSAVEL